MGLKALFCSTNFWTAIFATIFGVQTWLITKDHIVTGFVFSLFAGRIAAKGWQDVVKLRIGGTNAPPEKDDK